MPSAALEALKAELLAAKATLLPIIEGLEDYNRLNIKPETKQVVTTSLTAAKQRLAKIDAALAALEALEGTGYPDLNVQQVTEAVYADLKEQSDTIDAALAKFAPIAEASTVTIVPGTPTEQTKP